MPEEKTGLLLLNLGTPNSPSAADVRPYLRQFLSDPRVLDIPAWKRWLVLNLFILPFRPRESGEAYEKIWTEQGSPLLVFTQNLTDKVRRRFGEDVVVDLAMRYGEPSIPGALDRLCRAGVQRIVVFPLYPQYSSAATGSSLEEVFRCASLRWNVPYVHVVPPFYDHPAFVDASVRLIRPHLEDADPEVVFFSFHGVPERHVRKSDLSGTHCLERDDCCSAIVTANRDCYRAQCYRTAQLFREKLGIDEDRSIVCFQSRLGRDPWIRPYTDELVEEEARRGRKRALILSPAFVADCLETIEELGIRAAESWTENGGEELRLVPCLNDSDDWADAVVRIAQDASAWLDAGARSAATAHRNSGA